MFLQALPTSKHNRAFIRLTSFMKYTPLVTSALTLSLLVAGAVPAFAQTPAPSTNPTPTVKPSIQVRGDDEGEQEHEGGFLKSAGSFFHRGEGEDDGGKIRIQKNSSTTIGVGQNGHQDAKNGKDQENGGSVGGNSIDAQIQSLTELKARLAQVKLLDPASLATITANLDAEIAKLQALKSSGGTTASTTATVNGGDHKLFNVVEPKARIAASASRINAVVTQMTLLADKLQARITTAKTAGTDTTSAETALAELKAKIADAKVQADASVALTANLTPDNGDATIKASNLQALKDARAKLVVAQQDLATARHDAGTIYSVVKGVGAQNNASTTPNH